ncbi:Ctr copper transporter, partial [Syncephalis plumigaleata]
MTFNWNTHGVCVIFDWWQIHGLASMVLSCVLIAAIVASYEALRNKARKYDARLVEAELRRQRASHEEENVGEQDALHDNAYNQYYRISNDEQLVRAFLYALQTGIGYMIMLIFMTYNGHLMLATVIGAGAGYFLF